MKNGKWHTAQKHEILEFLNEHAPFAYSAHEIGREAIMLYPTYNDLITGNATRELRDSLCKQIERSLDALIETNRVESKEIEDQNEIKTVYRIKQVWTSSPNSRDWSIDIQSNSS